MDFDKFLGEMQKMITATQQGTLFGNKDAQAKAAADVCVDYLKGRGYSVGKPHNYPFKITKPDELISQFYWLVRKNFTNYLWSESNNKKDRVIAKALIESRMKKAGIDRQTAMNQCALIIDIIQTQ